MPRLLLKCAVKRAVKVPVLFLAASLLLFLTAHISAQSNAPGKTAKIASIAVTGSTKIPSDQFVAATGLKSGDVVSAAQIQEVADRISALGLFSSVKYRFSSKGDSIALEFQVQDAATVPLWFDNFPWFTDDELAGAIRQQVGLFAGEAPSSGSMLDQISDALSALLATHKITGTVVHELVAPPSGDGMVLLFKVQGAETKVISVHFGDALASNSEKLKDRISDIEGQPYSRFSLETFELEQLRPLYVAAAYLRARIGPPQSKLASNSAGVEVVIPIQPGTAYTWKGASWQGNVSSPSTSLNALLPLKPGDIADGIKLEDTWRKIESEYQQRGYVDAKLDAQPQFDDVNHQVSYLVSIVEGPQYRMGNMVITGLSVDGEKALRKAWQIPPGQIFDQSYFQKFIKILAKPSAQIFGEIPVHYTEFGNWLQPNTDRHVMDVLFDFK